MPKRDIIVIGGSAGTITNLTSLIKALPRDLEASIFIVVHLRPQSISTLPRTLSHTTGLEVREPQDGEPIQLGCIYVAPPNKHLLIEQDVIRLSSGPVENGFRPAVDALFRSAAYAYGPRVIGVVLSGMLDDGTLGLANVKRYGGVAVVQDPDDAEFPDMPRSALEHIKVDYVRPVSSLAELLITLTQEREEPAHSEMKALSMTTDQPTPINKDLEPLAPLFYSCPQCGGVLIPHENGALIHYQCEVKHIYSPLALFDEQNGTLERALWAGLRGLEEKARLAEQVAERAQAEGNTETAALFFERARVAKEQTEQLRQLIFGLT